VTKEVEIDVPKQIIEQISIVQQVGNNNTVTESVSESSKQQSKGGSATSSMCGDPTVASNHNDHSG
jgi:hypothetical protein